MSHSIQFRRLKTGERQFNTMGATPIDAVRQVQDICGSPVDGLIGPKTIASIKRWQSRHKLKADGLFGPRTKKKMEQVSGQDLDLWRWYYEGLGPDSPQPLFVDLAYYQAGWGWHSSGTVHISAPNPDDRNAVLAAVPGLYESRGTTDSASTGMTRLVCRSAISSIRSTARTWAS